MPFDSGKREEKWAKSIKITTFGYCIGFRKCLPLQCNLIARLLGFNAKFCAVRVRI